MSTSDHGSSPVDVPRFVILQADLAGLVLEYLEGLDHLVRLGDLDGAQLLLVTKGRPVPGPNVGERLASLIAEMAQTIRQQLEE